MLGLRTCHFRLISAQEDLLGMEKNLNNLRQDKRRLENELSVTRDLASARGSENG